MATNERKMIGVLAIAGVLVGAGAGCGSSAAISPQLTGARAVVAEARASSAAAREPDELLVAMRSLEAAENADDGSIWEQHYAYLAERQARAAMSDARRMAVTEGREVSDAEYQAELARLARERGVVVDTRAQRELAQRECRIREQEQALRDREAQLAAEQQARLDAEANAAAAMARLAELGTVRRSETVITLSGEVLFETNSAVLRPEARARLAEVASVLRSSQQSAMIAGFTDSRGTAARNERLSQERADSVRDFLVAQGVSTERLRAEGRGERSPVANNRSAEGRANNRRVEITLTPTVVRTTETRVIPAQHTPTPSTRSDHADHEHHTTPSTTTPPMPRVQTPPAPGSTQPQTPPSTTTPRMQTPPSPQSTPTPMPRTTPIPPPSRPTPTPPIQPRGPVPSTPPSTTTPQQPY